jgi:glutamate dehydrogenase (NAD(P)+)
VFCLEAALEHLDWHLSRQRVVVQGLSKGRLGGRPRAGRRGATIVGVSDVTGGVADPDGLDIQTIFDWVAEHRFLRGFPVDQPVGRTQVLETPCDVLVPAALEHQITSDNVVRIDCRLGGQGRQRTDHLRRRRAPGPEGIPIVPDVLANAGGVTVSYFEWVQDQQKAGLGRRGDRESPPAPAARRVRTRGGGVRAGRRGLAHRSPGRRHPPRGRGRAAARHP